MPRPREILSGTMTYEERHGHAIAKAVKDNKPFAVSRYRDVAPDYEGRRWAVVYTAPRGGGRYIAYGLIKKKAKANNLRDQLNRSWAEGFWSALQQGYDP